MLYVQKELNENYIVVLVDINKNPNIAEKYDVASITIIGVKPDTKYSLSTMPTRNQMIAIKNIIQSHTGNTKIFIESCFSPMLALTCETKLFGNLNVGQNKGCCAGRSTFSVNVDGKLSPCRHLQYYESFESLQEYMENSDIQKKIRDLEYDKHKPCRECKYSKYCRHCLAINSKINNELYIGNEICPIYEKLN